MISPLAFIYVWRAWLMIVRYAFQSKCKSKEENILIFNFFPGQVVVLESEKHKSQLNKHTVYLFLFTYIS